MANGRFPNQQSYLGALSGRPPMQQVPQAPLAGAGGSNPMAAILMGLGGGLSSRASGGTLGQGFTQGARLGMSMAQGKQLRARQKEILRRQDEADRREERRLKLLEEKGVRERTKAQNRAAIRKSALAGKAQASQSKVYSNKAMERLGLNPAQGRDLGNRMAGNPKYADSLWRYAEATGNSYVPPDVLARLGRDEIFDSIAPDGTVIMRPAPERFKKGTESTSLAINPAEYSKLFPNSGVR